LYDSNNSTVVEITIRSTAMEQQLYVINTAYPPALGSY